MPCRPQSSKISMRLESPSRSRTGRLTLAIANSTLPCRAENIQSHQHAKPGTVHAVHILEVRHDAALVGRCDFTSVFKLRAGFRDQRAAALHHESVRRRIGAQRESAQIRGSKPPRAPRQFPVPCSCRHIYQKTASTSPPSLPARTHEAVGRV